MVSVQVCLPGGPWAPCVRLEPREFQVRGKEFGLKLAGGGRRGSSRRQLPWRAVCQVVVPGSVRPRGGDTLPGASVCTSERGWGGLGVLSGPLKAEVLVCCEALGLEKFGDRCADLPCVPFSFPGPAWKISGVLPGPRKQPRTARSPLLCPLLSRAGLGLSVGVELGGRAGGPVAF